jgi:dTDP-4-amino-4,6-dideoxygalactose transaminase
MSTTAKANRIMGGVFALECRGQIGSLTSSTSRFLAAPRIELATARGAFGLLCESLTPRLVWLPSYLCSAIVDGFATANAQVRFYPLDDQLNIADVEWLDAVEANDLVVFIDYFGFDRWSAFGAEVRARGAWVVEDACQALLNDRFSEHAHYVLFSPRKFFGVPDGGILTSYCGAPLPDRTLPPPNGGWWLDSLAATQLRGTFDICEGDRRWFELFQKAEAHAPSLPTRMSELTSLLLVNSVDYAKRAHQRRENFLALAEALPDVALYRELEAGDVPLGFPMVFDDRDRALSALYEQQIYPAVHWPLENVVPKEFAASHRLSRRIATLPCDHRYTVADMRRMAALVRQQIGA